jgi:thioredoxin reductase (NADPH)
MLKMKAQAERFGTEIISESITEFDLSADKTKKITAKDGKTYEAKALVLALGSEYRPLNVAGEQEYLGKGVSFCATCDGFFFRNKEVIVVGGGDSAFHDALYLSDIVEKVTIVHRRQGFRASKVMQQRAAENDKIDFMLDCTVEKIVGDGKKVTGVILKNHSTNKSTEMNAEIGTEIGTEINTAELQTLPASAVFVAVGSTPNTSLLPKEIGLNKDGFVKRHDYTTNTNIEGVFAAGNMADFKYKQAITAAADGCKAAFDAEQYLKEVL